MYVNNTGDFLNCRGTALPCPGSDEYFAKTNGKSKMCDYTDVWFL